MTIQIVLADDHAVVRDGIAMLLTAEPDFSVVGEASDGQEALEVARATRPDVVLMDLDMPVVDGIEATRQLTADRFFDDGHLVKVLVVTSIEVDETVHEAIRAGASGFVVKTARRSALVEAVRAVAAGDAYLDSTVTRAVMARAAGAETPAKPAPEIFGRLTPREGEVLKLMADGLSNEEITARLVLSMATVKTHVCRIIGKLDARDRTEAVAKAYRGGFAQP